LLLKGVQNNIEHHFVKLFSAGGNTVEAEILVSIRRAIGDIGSQYGQGGKDRIERTLKGLRGDRGNGMSDGGPIDIDEVRDTQVMGVGEIELISLGDESA